MLSRLVEYSPEVGNSDDIRRGRLLNIMLVGVAIITLLIFLILIVTDLINLLEHNFAIYISTIVMLVGLSALYWLNQKGKVLLAGAIFLLLLTFGITFADSTEGVLAGRSLVFFIIPILMASFILRSYASFIVAAFLTIEHSLLWAFAAPQIEFSPFGMIGFFVFALVSWLAAQSLESALNEAREINQRLDELVDERTKELADANIQLEDQANELSKANFRLTELDNLKSKFVSDVSHELRTPISNLTIYLEMLEEKPEGRERYLAVLREETDRLGKLISDILDLSRMEMGTTKVEFAWININEIVEQVIIANRPRSEAEGVTLSIDTRDDLPTVWGDAAKMYQVINNLVGNAVNYTSEGSITVSTRLDAENELLYLKVKDTGLGIEDKDKPHLFERFYRGQQAGQSTIPGTGLGLAITKEIVDGHGGSIDVDSKIGEGSTFTISLPLGKPAVNDAALETESE